MKGALSSTSRAHVQNTQTLQGACLSRESERGRVLPDREKESNERIIPAYNKWRNKNNFLVFNGFTSSQDRWLFYRLLLVLDLEDFESEGVIARALGSGHTPCSPVPRAEITPLRKRSLQGVLLDFLQIKLITTLTPCQRTKNKA
eukprot:scaffold443_cov125-Cylindrotheca_fusiformis.AAC.43